jgi:anti-anti-sigma factor
MSTIAPGCELDVERGPGWLLVRVRNLDRAESDATPLADRLWSILEQHFTHRLVLELDDVGVLGSSLIGQLVELYRRIEEHDGMLRVCGLSPENHAALHVCRLDEHLHAYLDRHEAVMGSLSPGRPR